MGSDSKGALQQGGTHPLDTTMESSSITSQLSNPDSKVNRDKRMAETENLLNKIIEKLEKAYVSLIDYIRENESKQKEIEKKLNADKEEAAIMLQDDYNKTAREIELKNLELEDALQRQFKELFDEINRKIKELNEIIAFIEAQIKSLEEMYQSNFNDFIKNINADISQFINEIISDENDELYIHRNDLKQHIIDHLEKNIFRNLSSDNFPKDIALDISKGIMNAYHSFVQLHNLDKIKPKVEKVFKDIADKITNTFTTIHQKQLEVLQGARQAIAGFKELLAEKKQTKNILIDRIGKIEEAATSKRTSTKQQQEARVSLQSLKRSVDSINPCKIDEKKFNIKKQGMRESIAAKRASSPTTSPSPTPTPARSFIQKSPSTKTTPSTQTSQLPQENEHIHKVGRMGKMGGG